jgi:hypothetical protein
MSIQIAPITEDALLQFQREVHEQDSITVSNCRAQSIINRIRQLEGRATTQLSDFQQGALVAVSILIAMHDNPVAAADVVSELGLSEVDCTELDDYDKQNLKKIQGERGGSIELRGL